MTTYVLVHGAWHGAWCWEPLAPELATRGHTSVAMELPFDDATTTFDDCAAAVLAVCPENEAVVLVGHSLGGMVIPVVAAQRPVTSMVFLCSVVPNLRGMPWDDAPPMSSDYGTQHAEDGALVFPTLEAATATFYADCTTEDAAWAYARLRPLRNASLWDRPYPLSAWPDVRRAAITCVDDIAFYAEYQRATLEARLGIRPVELPGHHSPFLANPSRLAEALTAL